MANPTLQALSNLMILHRHEKSYLTSAMGKHKLARRVELGRLSPVYPTVTHSSITAPFGIAFDGKFQCIHIGQRLKHIICHGGE